LLIILCLYKQATDVLSIVFTIRRPQIPGVNGLVVIVVFTIRRASWTNYTIYLLPQNAKNREEVL